MSQPLRTAIVLATLVSVALVLVLGVERASETRVQQAAAASRAARLAEVLPPDAGVTTEVDATLSLARGDYPAGDGAPLSVERHYRAGALDALVLQVRAPDGYNGAIDLLLGIDVHGRIGGVRVIDHRETPGLGDDIERRRSDWITRFDGLSLETVPPSDWAVVPRGGRFDAFTGATLTPQAVVRSLHAALRWYRRHAAALRAVPRADSRPGLRS